MVQNKKDLIISAYTNYDWSKLKFWANSIDRSGFNGDKAMIVYNSDADTVKKLVDLGFNVLTFNRNQETGNFYWAGNLVIVVQRFYHLWLYLDHLPEDHYRFVISTDCKDVVFQSNPSDWLEKNINDKELVASCESLLYKDEPWGDDNLKRSYPMLHARLRNNPIWNCGVQAGRMSTIKDLWLQIWMSCHAAGLPNPDQAAYNFILNTRPWKSVTKFTMSEDGWAAQLGTTMDPLKIGSFEKVLLEPKPIFNGEKVLTSSGMIYPVVHQYDRIPILREKIQDLYS